MKILLRLFIWVTLTVVAVAQPIRPWLNPGISDPRNLTGLAAWYDTSTTSSMLNAAGTTVTTGQGVRLIADKSGNSAVNCLCLPGVAGNYASTPDSAAVDITGDIDLRVRVAMDDWTPSAQQCVIGKFDTGAAQRSYGLFVNTDGTLTFSTTTNGLFATIVSAISTVATSLTDLSVKWLRVTRDVDNGAGGNTTAFYLSDDGVTWTQLGNSVVIAGVTAIHVGTAALTVGCSLNGGATALITAGRIYRAQVYNGIDGTTVFDANFTTVPKLAPSFTESSSNAATVTINATGDLGAHIAGERDLYQATASKQPVYLPFTGTKYGYLNGVAGNYFSTPDSVPLSLSSGLDIRCYAAPAVAVPSAAVVLVSKFTVSGNQRSYLLRIDTAGKLTMNLSQDGAASTAATSSVAVGTANFEKVGYRATWRASDGRVQFFKRSDSDIASDSGWTQVGTDQSIAVASIFNGTGPLEIGIRDAATEPFVGTIYRTIIKSTIDGTTVFDFNPAAYVSGTTLVDQSSNAATITINGGATIVTRTCLYLDGVNDYMRSPLFALPQPVSRYTVATQTSWTSGDYLWDGASAANTGAVIQTTSTPQLNLNGGSSVAANTGLAIKTVGVVSSVLDDANSLLRINRGTATTGNAGAGVPNGYTLGASGAATAANFGNITFSESIIRSAADAVATQDAFILYEQIKWGIQ